jgi:hypothetical protein
MYNMYMTNGRSTNVQSKQSIISLSDFTHENVNEAFSLTQQFKKSDLLDKWIKRAKMMEISIEEKDKLTALQDKLLVYGKAWNVQELKERFISPITELVDFYNFELKFGAFSHRAIEATLHNTLVKGCVDWIVASGQYQPKQPFFFVNTHMHDGIHSVDPVGKLLATLHIAKIINQTPINPSLFNPNPRIIENIPLYGAYVIGSLWYFVRLEKQEYYISPAYDATYTEELNNIFRMLKAQKAMITDLVIGKPELVG